MKCLDIKKNITILILISLICSMTMIHSCDTPNSIAWSYYYCAEDTLKKGDPYAAKHFLDKCKVDADKVLAPKADSLMIVIEKAIEEKQY